MEEIASFTERGVLLRSGRALEADIIVTATGLNLQLLGGAELEIDGRPADPATTFSYKGVLYSDIPNLAAVFGGNVVADDAKDQIRQLREKVGELTMERDFLRDALGKFPGLTGKR